jgi:hypothetical protein
MASLGLAVIVSASLCAGCPISDSLVMRPFLAHFDSRYVGSRDATPLPFDPDLWRKGKARHRLGMAKHLVYSKILDGKTRSELVEMLGEPDIDKPGDEGMRWLLGYYAKGLFDESLWLELTMGEKGTAYGAAVGVSWYDPRQAKR